ncbi:phage minor head protein [Jeotgalibacillus haloalkalitolerans]|uniref:Phage minor head protein n=1 Tax=Jeotgalibacillus haloalkalitolerans TaxID=3104292 RepID=A0ABU5KK67_9BACL|nr:phage minor head protein [Jeotgalibacillus sp. HH7-29]MDZ5711649.1 phage minor head protein [Jeotgalibacillus sp. HH7-29]
MNQLQIEELLDKLLKQSEDDLEKVFNKRLRSIQFQVSEMYRKYEKDGELGWTEVNKYDRFGKEMANIAKELTGDYRMIIRELQKSLEYQYVEGYLRTAYLLENFAGSEMGFTVPSVEMIKSVLLNPIAELTLSAVMQQHRNEIVRNVNIEIAQGIQAGEGYSQIAKRLEKTVGFSKNKARLVARTESGRVRSLSGEKAEEQAAKFVEITGLWMSALDFRVRKSHRILDGQKTDKEGYFHYMKLKAKGPHQWNVASMDIQCRCVKLRLVNGMIPEVRRGRNYADPIYQQKLADRIEKYMGDESLTYKKALKQAQKEILPPSKVMDYEPFEKWKERQPKAS